MPGKAVAVVVCPSLTPCIMPGSPGLAQPCSTPGAGRHLPSIDGAPGPVARGGVHLAAGFLKSECNCTPLDPEGTCPVGTYGWDG